ncbi:unnamed protein product [Spirodela intermedia]|uniref:Uncharacterized protein n=1 Tax=Spirodela intermedia TaxID=51605 RepID=A0A7I8ISS9_SPIIN|nr:unnamed protein product [Spirodela intermedia]CAA6660629.1 unnamed protein product [Spirodela intermedia]
MSNARETSGRSPRRPGRRPRRRRRSGRRRPPPRRRRFPCRPPGHSRPGCRRRRPWHRAWRKAWRCSRRCRWPRQ